MNYIFPRTIFADTNDLSQQISHIMSESCEICRAYLNEGEDATVMEILDLLHSCETALWIVEKEKGPGYIHDMRNRTENKNRDRGYYGKRGEP